LQFLIKASHSSKLLIRFAFAETGQNSKEKENNTKADTS